MTLLEQIIQTSINPILSDNPLKYPFSFTSNSILSTLKIDPQNPNSFSILNPLSGFQISQIDSSLIEINANFFNNLSLKLKTPKSFSYSTLIELINPFLEKIGEIKFGGLGELKMGNDVCDYSCELISKFGSFVGRDVMGLIIEGCFLVENWKILEEIIKNKLVHYEYCSDLLCNLIEKRRSDLICLFIKHFNDMKGSDLCKVLKYFVCPSKEALVSMASVRKEWENEALLAIKKASDNKLNVKKVGLAKEAALLFMIAYDGFSSWELCLHYVVSSCVDDFVFSSAISKLNGEEMLGLIRYLGKWLKKYERFPEAGSCLKAGKSLLQWVPRVEDVVKCLGLVVDEHFSSLAMHTEFHSELKVIEEVVTSLVSEGRLCCSVANLMEIVKPEVVGA